MPNKHNIIKKIALSCFLMIPSFFVSCSNSTENSIIELESVLEQDLEKQDLEEEETVSEETKDSKTQNIYVFVCGAVKQEGVYELPKGSRVYEAVEKAGGFQEDAVTEYINQAEILQDEMQIYIPTQKELESGELEPLQKNLQEKGQGTGKININTATKEELMTLPGVGQAKADSIIKYRETSGKFKKIEDIMLISGIKEGLFEKIKNSITI